MGYNKHYKNMQETNFESQNLESEIQILEKKLEEKKLALGKERMPEGREAVKEIVAERIQEAPQFIIEEKKVEKPVSPHQVAPISPAGKMTAKDLRNLSKQKQIDVLVGIALSDSIPNAVQLANQLDPYILDELHDVLIDKFYQELLNRGKI